MEQGQSLDIKVGIEVKSLYVIHERAGRERTGQDKTRQYGFEESLLPAQISHDAHQIYITPPSPSKRPRHAFLPRWHFDMLCDTQRNTAYEKAIARAVEYKREFGCRDILTVDAGTGTGLLGMMAGIVVGLSMMMIVVVVVVFEAIELSNQRKEELTSPERLILSLLLLRGSSPPPRPLAFFFLLLLWLSVMETMIEITQLYT